MINFTSEKRKTQIDFNGLGLSPRLETDVLDQATQTPAGKEHGLGNRENPKQDAAKTSTRKRSLSPEEGGLEKRAGLKPLRLPEVVRSGIGAHEYLKTMHGSPWETHVKLFDIRLDEDDIFVTVAERQNAQHGTLIWKDPFSDLALIRHTNIISPIDPLEVFRFEGNCVELPPAAYPSTHEPFFYDLIFRSTNCYVAFEYMQYSLYYITGNPLLNEIRLAAIVGQILNGLMYLASEGLDGSLTCSTILIHPCGDDYELRRYNSTESRYIRALGKVVEELISGYPKEDEAIGHPLLHLPWWKELLIVLVSFTSMDTIYATIFFVI
ncbi:hypothetical protein V2W45_1474915 [Cenococcum geophilum]